MSIKLTIKPEILKALALFAAKKDPRTHLNAINIEIHQDAAYLVAANGKVMGAYRLPAENPEIKEPVMNVIIPVDMFDLIRKAAATRYAHCDIEIEIGGPAETDDNSRPIKISSGAISVAGDSIAGASIDWRRVIPITVSGKTAQFSPNILSVAGNARAILGGKGNLNGMRIGHNGNQAALVDVGNQDFIAVIMPVLDVDYIKSVPAWAKRFGEMDSKEESGIEKP